MTVEKIPRPTQAELHAGWHDLCENYAVDFSRTFLCEEGRATDDQNLLYARAREQREWKERRSAWCPCPVSENS